MQNMPWAGRVAQLKATDDPQFEKPSARAWQAMEVLILMGYLPRQTMPIIACSREGSIVVEWQDDTYWELSQDGETIVIARGNSDATLPYLQGCAAIALESAKMGRRNARRREAEMSNN